MTNREFIEEYGVREMLDIIDSMYWRLSLLKAQRKIGKFKISKKRRIITFYYKGKIVNYEVAKIYSINDDKLLSLLEKED